MTTEQELKEEVTEEAAKAFALMRRETKEATEALDKAGASLKTAGASMSEKKKKSKQQKKDKVSWSPYFDMLLLFDIDNHVCSCGYEEYDRRGECRGE